METRNQHVQSQQEYRMKGLSLETPGGPLEKMKAEARKNAKANFTWSKSSAEAIQFHKDVLQYFERYG